MMLMEFIGKQFVKNNNKGFSSMMLIFIIIMVLSALLFGTMKIYSQVSKSNKVSSNMLTAYSIAWDKYSELVSIDYHELKNESRHLSNDDNLDISLSLTGNPEADNSVLATITVYDRNTNEQLYSINERINKNDTSYDTELGENGSFRIPNGLTYKWGVINNVSYISGYTYTAYFTVPFPHQCLNVIVDPIIQQVDWSIYNTNTTIYDFDVNHVTFITSSYGYNPSGKIMWRAIGY